MKTSSLYQLWRAEKIKLAGFDVRSNQHVLHALNNKTSVYARSLEAMQDLHRKVLAIYEASPEQLEGDEL